MYRVRWGRQALDELANLWSAADSNLRQGITAASSVIDYRLQIDPQNEGESRSRGRRITFVPPLAIVFRVEVDGQTVSVLQVRLIRPRGQ